MLSQSDTSIAEILQKFSALDIDVGLLAPTATAFEKSIIDAHKPFREFLARKEVHDYGVQEQGQKALITAKIVTRNGLIDSKVSLYRPETKSGDPRVWIYNLKNYAAPNNLLAVIHSAGELLIVNCSDTSLLSYAISPEGPIGQLSKNAEEIAEDAAGVLLDELTRICAKGPIPTIINGDTGIGMTLESELGIPPNANAAPDFFGVELKASRRNPKRGSNRVTMFSKAPNWRLGPVRSAVELIEKRGYYDESGRLSLYHTMNGKTPNSLGLQLAIGYSDDTLQQRYVSDESNEHDTTWRLQDLRNSLRKKHPETFWVKADVKQVDGTECFHYVEATYTQSPKIEFIEALVEDGVITLDYTMHMKKSKQAVRDHGYLFKIHPDNFRALFPEPLKFDLR